MLLVDPTLFGVFPAHRAAGEFIRSHGADLAGRRSWRLAFRTIQLFLIKNVHTGLVRIAKIVWTRCHDIKLYHRAPLYLQRGRWIDPMEHAARSERRERRVQVLRDWRSRH